MCGYGFSGLPTNNHLNSRARSVTARALKLVIQRWEWIKMVEKAAKEGNSVFYTLTNLTDWKVIELIIMWEDYDRCSRSQIVEDSNLVVSLLLLLRFCLYIFDNISFLNPLTFITSFCHV